MKEIAANPLLLKSLNHISIQCRSVQESVNFYHSILGFVQVKRPGNLEFDGAWLFSYGIGIHLIQFEDPDKVPEKTEINPKDSHISFQYENIEYVEKKLKEMAIIYTRQRVEEGGIYVDQLFFHDPDGFMIEICNCDILPVIPIAGAMVRSCNYGAGIGVGVVVELGAGSVVEGARFGGGYRWCGWGLILGQCDIWECVRRRSNMAWKLVLARDY
ncbi:glyoxylase I 4-like [Bidens hawaiensis]|uniref:glyoxylase I 4-like n=1 Tax=Bidens hawaiensis TaxID=980011 RepID=UPI004049CE13